MRRPEFRRSLTRTRACAISLVSVAVVHDWHDAVAPYQAQLANERDPGAAVANAIDQLKVPFLKCVLSYALFFIAADDGYQKVWTQLNQVNSVFHLQHAKQPARRPHFRAIEAVRDLSITHMTGAPQGGRSPIDAIALMTWTGLTS